MCSEEIVHQRIGKMFLFSNSTAGLKGNFPKLPVVPLSVYQKVTAK